MDAQKLVPVPVPACWSPLAQQKVWGGRCPKSSLMAEGAGTVTGDLFSFSPGWLGEAEGHPLGETEQEKQLGPRRVFYCPSELCPQAVG